MYSCHWDSVGLLTCTGMRSPMWTRQLSRQTLVLWSVWGSPPQNWGLQLAPPLH